MIPTHDVYNNYDLPFKICFMFYKIKVGINFKGKLFIQGVWGIKECPVKRVSGKQCCNVTGIVGSVLKYALLLQNKEVDQEFGE